MYLVSPCTHLPKNSDPSLLKSCYQKTFDDGTHSTLSPALHFQGPRPPSWYYLAVTPLSGVMGFMDIQIKIEICSNMGKMGEKSNKVSKIQISPKWWDQFFCLRSVLLEDCKQYLSKSFFLECEMIPFLSRSHWDQSDFEDVHWEFLIRGDLSWNSLLTNIPKAIFWKLPPHPIAWFGILVWYSVLSSATRFSLKS